MMDLKTLDQQLRSLSEFESELMNLDGRDMKLHFSSNLHQDWKINNAKLMGVDEDIAIHKHDRFIDFEKHNHDYMEMMFVYSGEIVHEFDSETICLKKGELLLMDMNVSHSIRAASENDIAVNVLIKREFFDSYFLKQIERNGTISSFVVNAIYNKEDTKQYLYFRSGSNEKIWSLVQSILFEYYEKNNGMDTAVRAYMLLLFNELIRNYQDYLDAAVVSKVDTAVVVDIIAYIDEHYKTVSLKEMASFFNYNSDYLGKQIKKLTGESLRNLVKKRKMKEAALLLKNTDKTIMEILEAINYSNVSYFYKQFRSEFDVTPDEYRKM